MVVLRNKVAAAVERMDKPGVLASWHGLDGPLQLHSEIAGESRDLGRGQRPTSRGAGVESHRACRSLNEAQHAFLRCLLWMPKWIDAHHDAVGVRLERAL